MAEMTDQAYTDHRNTRDTTTGVVSLCEQTAHRLRLCTTWSG